MNIEVNPISEALDFGARISGLTRSAAQDREVIESVNAAFEKHGLIIFDMVEPSNEMQLALSQIFGPLKEHPVKSLSRVDSKEMPGVIKMRVGPDHGGIVELEGRQLSHWLPWHFDHCYNDELNRAGILRAAKISPDGGLTGFLDGIALYNAFPRELRDRIEDARILYKLNTQFEEQRFGQPAGLKVIRSKPMGADFNAQAAAMPRAIHPAVWTRASGEKVLHISPYMAEGIAGCEDEAGDALLEEVCQTINTLAPSFSYHHQWQPNEMLIWDNWRMLHCVSGHAPSNERIMYRTTIKGDYGLGCFENDGTGGSILEDTMV